MQNEMIIILLFFHFFIAFFHFYEYIYIIKEKHMKLNLRKKKDSTSYVGVHIYDSDRAVFAEKCEALGVKPSDVLRSLINSYIDGEIEIEL